MGLKDPQLERFSVLLGAGAVEDEIRAYIEVYGPKKKLEMDEHLVEILGNENVRKRILDVQEETKKAVIERTIGSDVWLLDMLRTCIQGAAAKGQYGVAIRGVELAARHPALNLFPQRVDHYRQKDPLEGKTPAEIRELARSRGLLRETAKVIEAEIVEAKLVEALEDGLSTGALGTRPGNSGADPGDSGA